MWDLIVSVPDHCLSFYFTLPRPKLYTGMIARRVFCLTVTEESTT